MAEKARVLWGAGTPRTMRAHWILHELDLAYESRPIGSRTGETQTREFLRLNPSGKIPVIEDGDLVLSESAAIVTYLAEKYGSDSGVLPPPATRERALYFKWSFFSMMELDATTMYVLRKHDDLKDIYGEAPNATRAAREGFQKQVRVAEQALVAMGPYILGERFTGADILLTTCLTPAEHRGIELSDALHEYLKRTTQREAYKLAHQANRPR